MNKSLYRNIGGDEDLLLNNKGLCKHIGADQDPLVSYSSAGVLLISGNIYPLIIYGLIQTTCWSIQDQRMLMMEGFKLTHNSTYMGFISNSDQGMDPIIIYSKLRIAHFFLHLAHPACSVVIATFNYQLPLVHR